MTTTKIHIVSDLHIEFAPYIRTKPKDTDIVIAAGDIATGSKGPFFLREIFGDYVPIVYVAGNHEHYGQKILTNLEEIRENAKTYNVHFLNNDTVEIDGVTFVGGTLWTDYMLYGIPSQYPSMNAATQIMNDFRRITMYDKGIYRRLIPTDTLKMHSETLEYIQRALKENVNKRTVVVTHMAPHPKSIHSKFSGDIVNPYYASDLTKTIEAHNPTLWVHGHMHDSFDYRVFDTRVICNPRGYVSDRNNLDEVENKAFNPNLLIDI